MEFVVGLPLTQREKKQCDIGNLDKLTNTVHFIAMRNTWTLDQLARTYLKEIVRLHRVPNSIVSDKDIRFISGFWQKLQKALGTLLQFSTAFHLATDGQIERTIQTLEDVHWACALDFKKAWDEQSTLIEFSYNNNYHFSIGMAPYETLHGRKCRTPLCRQDIDESLTIGPKLVQPTTEKVRIIQERMKAAQSRQKSYVDQMRRPLEFEVED